MKRFPLLLIFFVVIDFVFKQLALKYLSTGSIYFYKDWLGLELFFNKYIAFSIPINFVILIIINTIIILFLFYYWIKLIKKDIHDKKIFFITMLLGGAFGNLIDRFLYQSVIDYIVVAKFPVFNLADMFVVLGSFAWFYYEYKNECSRSSTDRMIPS